MEVVVYGYYGFVLFFLLMAVVDYLEYECFYLIDVIVGLINVGKVKVFFINSINVESWFNFNMYFCYKVIWYQQFNEYVFEEVVLFIKSMMSEDIFIIICGVFLGVLYFVNLFFCWLDFFSGVIGMSGDYDLSIYIKGYYDQDVYFNLLVQYLFNMEDYSLLM